MSLQRHLRILAGVEDTHMQGTLKVAFATTNRKQVNQHFGSAEAFAIYAIGPEQATLVEVAQFEDLHQDSHEDKLAAKLAFLKDCVGVYCIAVGGSAIRQLLARNIQPIRVSDGTLIDSLLQELKTVLRQGTATWLNKAMQRRQGISSDRFQTMEADGWQE